MGLGVIWALTYSRVLAKHLRQNKILGGRGGDIKEIGQKEGEIPISLSYIFSIGIAGHQNTFQCNAL